MSVELDMKKVGLSFPHRRLIYKRDLLRALVSRDMKLRYKRSVLGIGWSLLNPLAQLLVFQFIFGVVLPVNIPNYLAFLFTGILVWNWFQPALMLATSTVVDNRELIKRPGFPAAILPLVTITSHLIHFVIALPILVIVLILGGTLQTNAILALPVVIGLQFILTLSLAYFLATFQVTFRDTQYLLGVTLQLLFFLTPIFYDAKAIPEKYQPLYQSNPMVHLVGAYRAILVQGELPNGHSMLFLGLLDTILLSTGYLLFRRASYHFVEEL